MAKINGEWHDFKARKEVLDKLNEYIKRKLKNKENLSTDEKIELNDYITEYKRIAVVHRGETDLLFFNYAYFGDNLNPGNTGNWIPEFEADHLDLDNKPELILEFAPEFHAEICDIMNVVSNEEINKKVAVAAPRSHAKSSYLSKGFPIHEIVYRKRKYIILISETPMVSSANLDWIKLQLEENDKLCKDFGKLLNSKQDNKIKNNSSEFIAWEEKGDGKKNMLALVQAASSGQALRGRSWNGIRPEAIVCDDIDSEKNTNTEQLRTEMKDWFRQTVIPLGDPEGKKTAYIFMGTTIHHDSLLINVMKHRSDFDTKHYKALIDEPTRTDLWESCRKIYMDRENKSSAKIAELFYIANKDEMDKGVKVLWPNVQPIFKLMAFKWDNGSKAFNSELQNNPLDTESMIFDPSKFVYWDDVDPNRTFSHAEYYIYIGVDFAMGKKKGDYSAIVVIAKHKQTGVYYVIDSYIERVKVPKFMKVVVKLTKKWQPERIAAEAVAAQEFFVDQLKDMLEGSGYPAHRRVDKIYSSTRKDLRIEALGPDIEAEKIQFSRKHTLLLEQFEQYPQTNDDGPDACEMAISIAKVGKRMLQDKPDWL